MSNQKNKNTMSTVKVIGGFLAGATIGAVAGLLLAPESGRKTRKKMMDESRRLTDQFTDSMSRTFDSVKDNYNKKLDEFAKRGKVSLESLKDSMKTKV